MGKTVALQNYETGTETRDRLATKATTDVACSRNVCLGSLMSAPPPKKGSKPKTTQEVLTEAETFLEEFFTEKKLRNSQEHQDRLQQVKAEVERSGSYEQTFEELSFGAKLAWRNAPRCIGRIQWSNLKLFDARHVQTASEMFTCMLEHIQYATNGGNLRSTITVFPQRTDGFHDFKVWNKQIVSYAGYENDDGTITGDPASVEFTKVCMKLGWRGKGTEYDVLPLVLQARGQPPECFPIPEHMVLQIEITHPEYDAIRELGIKWYALPAVSSMMLDCGGIEYTAAPFNGWYMSTEVGTRDICDTYRYNKVELIASKLRLDTSSPVTLWKDKAMLEINRAVLHSYQKKGVTIWDHHTAADTFMQHYENEIKTRGGCPADWVWLIPPMSSGLSPVFHQELALYYLKPSYEYQELAWRTYKWDGIDSKPDVIHHAARIRKRPTFRVLSKAARFCAALYLHAVAKRPKVLILYATESGKAEKYAKKMRTEVLKYQFQVSLSSMADYKVQDLSQENIVLFIASTFGTGDPPTNGEAFKRSLEELNSKGQKFPNLKFAVFALGSSSYPHFCAFGKFLDNTMLEMGAKSILEIVCGDEMKGQEQTFKNWVNQIIQLLVPAGTKVQTIAKTVVSSDVVPRLEKSVEKFRLALREEDDDLPTSLSRAHGKTVYLTRVVDRRSWKSDAGESKTVIYLALNTFGTARMKYRPGDHIAIFPAVHDENVLALLKRLEDAPEPETVIQLETQSQDGKWTRHQKLPTATALTLFSRFVDISSPPSQEMLLHWADFASEASQVKKLRSLAEDNDFYENWCSWVQPDILSALNEFWSVSLKAADLLGTLPLLKPRYYSISSSPEMNTSEIHVTIGVTSFRTRGGQGPWRYGVCSSYLRDTQKGDFIACHVKSAEHFHLPEDKTTPVILVGPGTGIAPFRGFWQQREVEIMQQKNPKPTPTGLSRFFSSGGTKNGNLQKFGPMVLYFGCRDQKLHLYAEDMERVRRSGALTQVHVAYSRDGFKPKMYVQDLIKKDAEEIFKLLLLRQGHLYICGEATMSSQVLAAIRSVIEEQGNMTMQQADYVVKILKEENRIHEDIFAPSSRW